MPFSFAHSMSADVRFSLDAVVVPPLSAVDAVTADRDVNGADVLAGGDEDAARWDDGTMTNAAESHRRRRASLHSVDNTMGSAHARRGVPLLLLVEDGPIF
jgi:hypothetical protein